MREIRGQRRAVIGEDASALFGFWRRVVMGNRGSKRRLPESVAGYFYTPPPDASPSTAPTPIPLGVVRRSLLDVLDRVDLTDAERTVVDLYFGLNGLPLPFSSTEVPDIAGGRNESSPRETCRSALRKIGAVLPARALAGAPDQRPVVDPTLEPWFRAAIPAAERAAVTARAYVRAVSGCDGPHGAPTRIALEQWYRACGIAYLDLSPPAGIGTPGSRRPNGNALARAAALMEIALHQEIANQPQRRPGERWPPLPAADGHVQRRLPETVTHPTLLVLLDDDLSPEELMTAASTLEYLAVNGGDVSGSMALFLRCVRPRIASLSGMTLERLAVSVSYVAAVQGNPFLALEWLGVFLHQVGVTDRTFTVLVNTMEAAAAGGYHDLSYRIEYLFREFVASWEVPAHQIKRIEHVEVEQQRLAAHSYRLVQLGRHHEATGNRRRALKAFRSSIELAERAAGLAHQVLTDTSVFPRLELDGKVGDHGGDLTWPWLLAGVACMTEPLDRLRRITDGARVVDGGDEWPSYLRQVAGRARSLLSDYDGPLDTPRFQGWWDQASTAVDHPSLV